MKEMRRKLKSEVFDKQRCLWANWRSNNYKDQINKNYGASLSFESILFIDSQINKRYMVQSIKSVLFTDSHT